MPATKTNSANCNVKSLTSKSPSGCSLGPVTFPTSSTTEFHLLKHIYEFRVGRDFIYRLEAGFCVILSLFG